MYDRTDVARIGLEKKDRRKKDTRAQKQYRNDPTEFNGVELLTISECNNVYRIVYL